MSSNTTTLVDPSDVFWAIRTHAPLMSERMLGEIMKSIGGRERTLTQDDDRLLGLAALWLAPHEERVKAQEWFLKLLDDVWVEVSDVG